MATYTRLRSGEWGIRITDAAIPRPGDTVAVQRRDGETRTERVVRVLWSGDGVAICAIERRRRAAGGGSGADWRYLRDGTPGPVRGCARCRQLGRMCRQCEFDEFDM